MAQINKSDFLEKLQKKSKLVTDVRGSDGWKYYSKEEGKKIEKVHRASLIIQLQMDKYSIRNISMDSENDILAAYTKENMEMVIRELPTRIKEEKQAHKEYLKTKEGKAHILNKKVQEFAQSTAVDQDHHGIYQSGDDVYISVIEAVNTKKDLKKYHASGELLALVKVSRERTYSKQYTRQFGKGRRSDKYLIGQNETGTRFAHPVSDSCETLEQAINWIWDNNKIIARHGDIAITESKTVKNLTGQIVNEYQIMDSHVFTGELHKNGSTYVRNGTLIHKKGQHPDVHIGNDWMKIIRAKRYRKANAIGTRD
jgi:hypothetical protein